MDYQFIKYAIEGTMAYGAIRAACLSDPYESDIGKTQEEEEEEEVPDDWVHVDPLNPDYLITPVVNKPKEENELKQAFDAWRLQEDSREKKIDSITWNNQNYWEKLLTTGKNDHHIIISTYYCCESCEALGIPCLHKRFIRPAWKTKSRQEKLEAVFSQNPNKEILFRNPKYQPMNGYKPIITNRPYWSTDRLRGSTADMVCVCFDCSIDRRVKAGLADPGYKLPPWNLIKDSYDESELLYKGESKIIILEEAAIIPKELLESVVRPLLSSNLCLNKNLEYKKIADEKKAGDSVSICPDSFASEIEMCGRLQKELTWGNDLDIQFKSATEYTIRNNNPDYKPEIGEDVFAVPPPFKGWPAEATFHPVGFIDPDYKSKNGEDVISVRLVQDGDMCLYNNCWMCDREHLFPDPSNRVPYIPEPLIMQQLRDAINSDPKPVIKNERKTQPIKHPKYPNKQKYVNRYLTKQKGYKRANNQRGMKKLAVRK